MATDSSDRTRKEGEWREQMETDDSTGGKGARGERKDEEGKSLCREKRIHRLIEEDLKKKKKKKKKTE